MIGGVPRCDGPDAPGEMSTVGALMERLLNVLFRHHKAITDSHVEGVPEVAFRNLSSLLQPVEQGRTRPAVGLDLNTDVGREAAGKIFGNPSTCDVCHPMDGDVMAQQGLHQVWIKPRWFQQVPNQGALVCPVTGLMVSTGGFENPANKAVAIAVNTAAGDADHLVPCPNFAAINHLIRFDHSNAETGEVVTACWIKARHFSGFAAQQSASAASAALGDAFYDLGHGFWAECPCGHVVEKEERLGA